MGASGGGRGGGYLPTVSPRGFSHRWYMYNIRGEIRSALTGMRSTFQRRAKARKERSNRYHSPDNR